MPATDLSAAALTELILQEPNKLGLKIENLRGQGYDGGSNMAGKIRGVQARIKELQLATSCYICTFLLTI